MCLYYNDMSLQQAITVLFKRSSLQEISYNQNSSIYGWRVETFAQTFTQYNLALFSIPPKLLGFCKLLISFSTVIEAKMFFTGKRTS